MLTVLSAFASEPALLLPAPQVCLEGLFADDPEFAVFEGLSSTQLSESITAFTPHLLRCMPSDSGVLGTVTLQMTVGCDGRVSSVEVEESEALSDAVVSCVSETMAYAAFPAHDTPDGVSFLYPMHIDVPQGARLVAR